MNTRPINHGLRSRLQLERGSVLVIVLLIATGLISIALYFANSMSLELRAADNRASGIASEQAIEGGVRYISSMLGTYATNGFMPDINQYEAEAVPIGVSMRPEENPRFWIIGRDPAGNKSSEPHFALIDESSKLDLNAPWITADTLTTNIARMTQECAEAIIDWRDTNGTSSSLSYSQLGYLPKHAAFESVAELRLLTGTSMELLVGEDINRNGILDANETDTDRNGEAEMGLMDYFTVYSREPGTHLDGTSLTNVNNRPNLFDLLDQRLGSSRASQIETNLLNQAAQGQNQNQNQNQNQSYASLLQFYLQSGMTADEFAQVYSDLTATTNNFTIGRVNINTAPVQVLACLPGMDLTTAQTVVNYRESSSINHFSTAWIVDALGRTSPAVLALARGDYITAHSYQFTADVAAVGPYGRGYRRMRFVFDLSDGTPKIIYRQDLSRLGWALGRETRETWVARNTR